MTIFMWLCRLPLKETLACNHMRKANTKFSLVFLQSDYGRSLCCNHMRRENTLITLRFFENGFWFSPEGSVVTIFFHVAV